MVCTLKNLLLLLLFSISLDLAAQQKKILIAYYSKDGHTKRMAEAVENGALSTGAKVTLKTVDEISQEELLEADAIIIGSPVYNANVAPDVQAFINAWPFEGSPLKDKLGAAFVTAGGISAGEETVQLAILRSMLVFGMVVAGGPDWKQAFGASAINEELKFVEKEIDEVFLKKGEALGKRIGDLLNK